MDCRFTIFAMVLCLYITISCAEGISIKRPTKEKKNPKDKEESSGDSSAWHTARESRAVYIIIGEEDDNLEAPGMEQIQPTTIEIDASKVFAKGPGLEEIGVTINNWATFTVDARKAGTGPLQITCIDASYNPLAVEISDQNDSTFNCRYYPTHPVKHTIIITWGLVNILKSPFKVYVSVRGNVNVYGPGVEKSVAMNVKTYFTVDCTEAGAGDVGIVLVDERGKNVPFLTTDNKDGTFTVEYEPTTPGEYNVQIYLAETEIPKSPIKVNVEFAMSP